MTTAVVYVLPAVVAAILRHRRPPGAAVIAAKLLARVHARR